MRFHFLFMNRKCTEQQTVAAMHVIPEATLEVQPRCSTTSAKLPNTERTQSPSTSTDTGALAIRYNMLYGMAICIIPHIAGVGCEDRFIVRNPASMQHEPGPKPKHKHGQHSCIADIILSLLYSK